MKTGQRVVCIKDGNWKILEGGQCSRKEAKQGLIYTVRDFLEDESGFFISFMELHKYDYYFHKHFIPLDENWTEEVITKALKQQLTKPLQTI